MPRDFLTQGIDIPSYGPAPTMNEFYQEPDFHDGGTSRLSRQNP